MYQLYDDGSVAICSLVNTSASGDFPQYILQEVIVQSFEERSIGLNRSYLAKGVDERVDMVIRIQNEGVRPRIGQYAVITGYEFQENENGDQYRIDMVQPEFDENELRVFDLTLARLEENYDVHGTNTDEQAPDGA